MVRDGSPLGDINIGQSPRTALADANLADRPRTAVLAFVEAL
jgi:hypothetical protein